MASAERVVFRAPAQMNDIVGCSAWSLGEVTPGAAVTVDLGNWWRIAPTAVIGIVCTLARLAHERHALHVIRPRDNYARRMLATVGFAAALDSFGRWERSVVEPLPVRRILPIIPVHNFQSELDVEQLIGDLHAAFGRHPSRLPRALLGDAANTLAEAAANVKWHAESPVGGYALAQLRFRRFQQQRLWFLEVAIGDPGIGIRASFRGWTEDDDVGAIRFALQGGRSSLDDPYRGYGLHAIRTAVERRPLRVITIHSGRGWVSQIYDREFATTVRQRFHGTLLTAAFPLHLDG